MGMDDRIIGHIDMDAFFAAVEERDKPWLKGLPVVIGADPKGGVGRGVVATANYAARKYGIHSALPIQKAWSYSESARKRGERGVVFITSRGRRYAEISKEVFDIVSSYVDTMQITSIDEAYFDITNTGSYEEAKRVARQIKKEITQKTKLTGSIGIGPNKMIAKIASDLQKPDGLTIISADETYDLLARLPLRTIPGIGPKVEEKFKRLGIATVEGARIFSWQEMQDMFGSHGFSLYQKLRGSGSVTLREPQVRKSIGKHKTFPEDTIDLDLIHAVIEEMGKKILASLHKKRFTGFRTIVLTVRFGDFETKSRSLTSSEPVHSLSILQARALKLLLPFFEATENPKQKKIRMVGLRLEKLQ